MTEESTQALVLAGHGSHLNPRSDRPVFDHADVVRERGMFEEVRTAFWKEEPSFREVLRTVESDEAYVVPLFVSEGYFTEQVLPRELGLTDADAPDADVQIRYASPVGTHDAMTDVVVRRVERVTGDRTVGDGVGVAVVGHGTERNESSARATERHVRRIRERGRFDEVRALFMDESPYVEDVYDEFDSESLVVVPLFVADGYHTTEDIPEDLGLVDDASGGDATFDAPVTVDGRQVWYSGAVGTEPLVADVAVERAADAGAEVAGDGTEVAGDGTEVAGDGTEVADDGTEVADDGTEVADDGLAG